MIPSRIAQLILSAATAVSIHAFAADMVYQPTHFDLSGIPSYTKTVRVTGVIRIYGTPLDELVGRWYTAFRGYHGQTRLQAYLINTSQAFAGLITGQADIGIMGHRQWHNGFVAFREQFGYEPVEIKFASGSYDDPAGTTPGLMFIVNKKNPLAGLTLDQIDGIYGAQRTGGWVNARWSTAAARGPEKDIRTWDQLGLAGDFARKPIHAYGFDVTLSNWSDLIEREAFQGGTKWNPALVEAPRADIGTKAKGKTRDQLTLEAVEKDPYAIGFLFQRVINANHGDVRVLPLARRPGEPFVTPSAGSFFNATYPMRNGAYLYVNRVPGHPFPAREKEFIKFVLSRQGQQIVADTRLFIPLSADQIQAELAKLE
jgi:phosphate transport system substrate-binding protein